MAEAGQEAGGGAAGADAAEEGNEDDDDDGSNDDVLQALEDEFVGFKRELVPPIMTAEQHAQMRSILTAFYDATVKAVFAANKALRQQEKYNRQQLRQRGDVDETHLKATETAKDTFEKTMANCRVLAEALGLQVPQP